MAETITLKMIVGDLADSLCPERLPGEIAVAIPAAGGAGHALAGRARRGLEFGPLGPRMALDRIDAQRRQFLHQRAAFVGGKAGGDPGTIPGSTGVNTVFWYEGAGWFAV